MSVATLLLAACLLVPPVLTDVGYDSRLLPVELAIIKSVVDAVPGGDISSGNPFDWTAFQSRSRALQGADIQVVQVNHREPDFSGRSGGYPDDASIVQAVSSQLDSREGPGLEHLPLSGGSQGWNVLRSVSAELHLDAQLVPSQHNRQPLTRQVSHNYQQPAYNNPPVSSLSGVQASTGGFHAESGGQASTGGANDYSFHRSIASELNAAMFGDVPAYQPARQTPVAQGRREEQHYFRQQAPVFNNNQQFSFVPGGQNAGGGGNNDFSIQRSIPYDIPSDTFVPMRPPPVPQARVDFGQPIPLRNNYNYNNQHLSGAQKQAGGLSEFSIQRSIASELPSDSFTGTQEEQRVPQPIDIRISGNNDVFSSSSGVRNSGGGFELANQLSVSNDIPSDLVAPAVPQAYNQPSLPWNANHESGDQKSGGGESDFSIQRSIGSEISSGGGQSDFSQSQGFEGFGLGATGGQQVFHGGQQVSHGGQQVSHGDQQVSHDGQQVSHDNNANDFSIQRSEGSEISSGEGYLQSQPDSYHEAGGQQVSYDHTGSNYGHETHQQVSGTSAVQEKADFVEVNIVRTVSSQQVTDEAASSDSHTAPSDTGNSASSEEDNSVQDSSGESQPSEDASGGVEDQGAEVHTPDREETPPLETEPCEEGQRRIKNVCRKVYSLQLKAHLRKK